MENQDTFDYENTSVSDILKSLVATSAMGNKKPMVAVTLSLSAYDPAMDCYKEIDKTTLINVGLSFIKTDGYMEANIIYEDNNDMKLSLTMGIMDKLKSLINDGYYEDDDVYPPYLSIMFTPMEYEGRFHFVGEEPLFSCLCSDNPKEYPHIMKFLFDEESFILIETKHLDAKRIISEIKRSMDEEEKRALYEKQQVEKLAQEIEYEEARIKMHM